MGQVGSCTYWYEPRLEMWRRSNTWEKQERIKLLQWTQPRITFRIY